MKGQHKGNERVPAYYVVLEDSIPSFYSQLLDVKEKDWKADKNTELSSTYLPPGLFIGAAVDRCVEASFQFGKDFKKTFDQFICMYRCSGKCGLKILYYLTPRIDRFLINGFRMNQLSKIHANGISCYNTYTRLLVHMNGTF